LRILGDFGLGLRPGPQRGAHAVQRVGVVPQVRLHGRRQREVLGRGAGVARAREGEAESELRIVVAGASVYDAAKVAGRRRVLAGVELGPGERLEYAPGPRFGDGGAFEQLSRGGRTAAAEQVEPAPVEQVSVSAVGGRRVWSVL
jgi:hypothetical protein